MFIAIYRYMPLYLNVGVVRQTPVAVFMLCACFRDLPESVRGFREVGVVHKFGCGLNYPTHPRERGPQCPIDKLPCIIYLYMLATDF